MAYEFKVIDHLILPGKQAIECWRDGVFVAGIYPHQDGIRVVSKYMREVRRETVVPASTHSPEVAAVVIELAKS